LTSNYINDCIDNISRQHITTHLLNLNIHIITLL